MGKFDEARRVVVAALRNNHRGYRQVRGRIQNLGTDDRCATGLAAESLHVSMTKFNNSTSVYEAVKSLTGDIGVTQAIVDMNDNERLSFKKIGDRLALRWGIE